MAPTEREEVSDETLMVQFRSGDRAAFASLVRRYKVGIYNFILRQVRTPAVAEDLAQDVFMRVVQKGAEFRSEEARFSTWVFTIARNFCIDHQRKMSLRRHPSLDQAASPGTGRTLGERTADTHPSASVERLAIKNELSVRIASAVEELPPDQREVFLLREVASIPFKDIAEMIGVPESTAKSRMRYALERLQEALSEYEDYARALR